MGDIFELPNAKVFLVDGRVVVLQPVLGVLGCSCGQRECEHAKALAARVLELTEG